MRIELRSAIEALINDRTNLDTKLDNLAGAYARDREAMTETSRRIEFLEDCLVRGMSKREAARQLVKYDPRIGQSTAETLVYINFSGSYQTTMRGRKKGRLQQVVSHEPEKVDTPADVEDDEGLL